MFSQRKNYLSENEKLVDRIQAGQEQYVSYVIYQSCSRKIGKDAMYVGGTGLKSFKRLQIPMRGKQMLCFHSQVHTHTHTHTHIATMRISVSSIPSSVLKFPSVPSAFPFQIHISTLLFM
jgi:hypothetical protein